MSSIASGDTRDGNRDNADMATKLSKMLREARDRAKLSQERVGELTGASRSAVNQWESGKTKPDIDKLPTLAKVLHIDTGELIRALTADGSSAPMPERPTASEVIALDRDIPPPLRSDMPRDVPVLGTVVGGSSGDFLMNGDRVDFVRRPPRLLGRRDVFAVYVQGVSMEPRYFSGELLYLEGNRPPHIGDFVVVECKASESDPEHPAYLKQLAATTPTKLKLRQFNPAEVIEIDRRKVLKVYRVMGLGDLLGV